MAAAINQPCTAVTPLDAGWAQVQSFPADQYSKELFVAAGNPQSNGNTWQMYVYPEKFTYRLVREGREFRVDFDLSKPVALPPTPWGYIGLNSGKATGQGRAAEQVHVDVENGLAAVAVAVHHQPVAVIGDADRLGIGLRRQHQLAQHQRFRIGHIVEGVEATFRHEQYMHRRLRGNIAEGDDLVVLEHDVGRNFTVDDFFEDALTHTMTSFSFHSGHIGASTKRMRQRAAIDILQFATNRHAMRQA